MDATDEDLPPEVLCDYCDAPIIGSMLLRPIGFDELNGKKVPKITIWCGDCEPGDEINQEAKQMIIEALEMEGK